MNTKRQLGRSYLKPTLATIGKALAKAKSNGQPKSFRDCAINMLPMRGRKKYGEVHKLPEEKGLHFEVERPQPEELPGSSPEVERQQLEELPGSASPEVERQQLEELPGSASPEQLLGACMEESSGYERSFDLEVQTPLSPFSGLGNTSRSQAETLREATRRSEKLQKKLDEERQKNKETLLEATRRSEKLQKKLDEERQKNKTTSKKYKRRSFTPSEAYRRKIDPRNVASLRKKTPSKKYKRRSFTPSEAYRRKIDKRNVASLRKKLVDWYARTVCFSVALTLLEGGVVYSGPPALKEFGENKEVKEAFLALIPKPDSRAYGT